MYLDKPTRHSETLRAEAFKLIIKFTVLNVMTSNSGGVKLKQFLKMAFEQLTLKKIFLKKRQLDFFCSIPRFTHANDQFAYPITLLVFHVPGIMVC